MTRYDRKESDEIYMRAVAARVNTRSDKYLLTTWQSKQHGELGFMYRSRGSGLQDPNVEAEQETFSEKVRRQLRQGRAEATRLGFYPTEDDFRVVVGPSPFPDGRIPEDINEPMG